MKDYNFTSAIVRMPFGKHKDKLFWSIGLSYFKWLLEQNHTPATERTIEDAVQLFNNEGAFAVMRRSRKNKYVTELVIIMQSERMANARLEVNTDDWEYFVYPIQNKEETKKVPPGYFPNAGDYFAPEKNQ